MFKKFQFFLKKIYLEYLIKPVIIDNTLSLQEIKCTEINLKLSKMTF